MVKFDPVGYVYWIYSVNHACQLFPRHVVTLQLNSSMLQKVDSDFDMNQRI